MAPARRHTHAQLQPTVSDFASQEPAVLGRGQRESRPTERIQTFRQSITKANTRLDARRVSASTASQERTTIAATASEALADSEDERQNDPYANDTEAGEDDNEDGPQSQSQVVDRISVSRLNNPLPQPPTFQRAPLIRRYAAACVLAPATQPNPNNPAPSSSAAAQPTPPSQPQSAPTTEAPKRSSPGDNSESDEDEPPVRKSKPKASNLPTARRAVILAACTTFRLGISTVIAFPDGLELDDMAFQSFRTACSDLQAGGLEMTDDEMKVIKARASQMRGQVVTNAKTLIKSHYGFISDADEVAIEQNRQLFARLTDHAAYAYTNPSDRKVPRTLYRNAIIMDVIQKTWFANRRDEGIVHASFFDDIPDGGLPLVTLALVLTAIECGLDEWKTGIHTGVEFSEKNYGERYFDIVETLFRWRKFTDRKGTHTALNWQKEIVRRARMAVGIRDNQRLPSTGQIGNDEFAADDA